MRAFHQLNEGTERLAFTFDDYIINDNLNYLTMIMISQTGSIESETKIDVDEDDLSKEYKIVLKWRNIIVFIYLHVFAVWCLFDPPHLLSTYIIQIVLMVAIGFGTTVGSHR